jgi:hypothetical protein
MLPSAKAKETEAKLRQLLGEITAQHESCAKKTIALQAAEADAAKLSDEMARLERLIQEEDSRIARSGGALPISLMKEEEDLKCAARQLRILQMRAKTAKKDLADCKAAIGTIREEIDAVWEQLGKQIHSDHLDAFEAAALILKDRIMALEAVCFLFAPYRRPATSWLKYPNAMAELARGQGHYFHTTDPVFVAKLKELRQGTDAYKFITGLNAEIRKAKAGAGS